MPCEFCKNSTATYCPKCMPQTNNQSEEFSDFFTNPERKVEREEFIASAVIKGEKKMRDFVNQSKCCGKCEHKHYADGMDNSKLVCECECHQSKPVESMEEGFWNDRFWKEFVVDSGGELQLRYGMGSVSIKKLREFIRQEIDRAVEEYKKTVKCLCCEKYYPTICGSCCPHCWEPETSGNNCELRKS